MIRKAKKSDIDSVAEIYRKIHDQKDSSIGWIKDVYPTRKTAADALDRGDLFVYEVKGKILAAAIINHIQDDAYYKTKWENEVSDVEVCVIHTLVVLPEEKGKGIGKDFIRFYEDYAKSKCWYELRLDTNEKNFKARNLYKSLGYKEVAIVPTVFNNIPGVNLVLIEKSLKA